MELNVVKNQKQHVIMIHESGRQSPIAVELVLAGKHIQQLQLHN